MKLENQDFESFMKIVLGEPESNPGLQDLLSRPSVFDEA